MNCIDQPILAETQLDHVIPGHKGTNQMDVLEQAWLSHSRMKGAAIEITHRDKLQGTIPRQMLLFEPAGNDKDVFRPHAHVGLSQVIGEVEVLAIGAMVLWAEIGLAGSLRLAQSAEINGKDEFALQDEFFDGTRLFQRRRPCPPRECKRLHFLVPGL